MTQICNMVSRLTNDNYMPPLVCISELPNPALNKKCGLGLNAVLALVVCCLLNHEGHSRVLILFLCVKVYSLDSTTFDHAAQIVEVEIRKKSR